MVDQCEYKGGRMTDRYSGFHVTLDRDMREDDAEATLTALRQIKGVAVVEPVHADFSRDHFAAVRQHSKVEDAILYAVHTVLKDTAP